MNKFLLIIIGLTIIPFLATEVYATHYSSIGLDDVFLWREYDAQGITIDVNCTWLRDDGINNIEFAQNDNGIDETGYCMMVKSFKRSDIQNVGGSNVFTYRFEGDTPSSSFYSYLAVLDGNYEQYVNNVDTLWQDNGVGGAGVLGFDSLQPGTWGDLESITGFVKTSLECHQNSSAGFVTPTLTCTISDSEWNRALSSDVTIIFGVGRGVGTGGLNQDHRPEALTITNTPHGTLQWNWPETEEELANWQTYTANELQLNGTLHDYGWFMSLDESVPDPPTNLFALTTNGDISLDWEAPAFNGYDSIYGYKIERESPVGGGWIVIEPNTFSTDTFYTDTSVTPSLNEYNYRVRAINSHGESLPSNESKDGVPTSNNEIVDVTPTINCDQNTTTFTLYAVSVGATSVDLCWNGEILDQHDLIGYQINFTTPWGDPLTEIISDTGSNETTRKITSLSSGTQYSMRVQSINSLEWDISRLTSNSTESVSTQSNDPKGIESRTSGTNIYITDTLDDKIYQYNMTSWDIDSIVYDNELSVVTNADEPTGICFRTGDGGKVYVTSNVNDRISEYDLSIAWNVTSGTHYDNFSLSGEGNQPEDCYFLGTGTTMYTLDGGSGDKVTQWSLSTAWNTTTATKVAEFDVSNESTEPTGLDFGDSGLIMYIMDSANDEIEEYDLGTPYDITTAVHYQSKSVSSADTSPYGLYLKSNDKLYFTGSQNDSIYEWDFDTSILPTYNQTNIVNFTTYTTDFDIGELMFETGNNTSILDWHWVEQKNGNDTSVLVDYPDTFNATCTFNFRFANTNQTYSNISTLPYNDERVYANFTFTNSTNDIVTINCIDENSDSDGMYVLTQTGDFPLFEQIANFRNGTYGTMGMFGVFDFFTLAIIIFSMVGFNRVNSAVGGVFAIMILGVASYFGFIEGIFSHVVIGFTILVVTLMFVVHNRNDVAN